MATRPRIWHRLQKHHRWALASVASGLLVGGGIVHQVLPTHKATQPNPSVTTNVCINPEPLKHVYHPNRLIVLDTCKTVSGTVVKIKHEPDGDTHIQLNVDPPYQSLLAAGNSQHQGGNLVLEIVCAFPVTQADAIGACKGYANQVTLPSVGDAVSVTGQLVTDTVHGGWTEIHPVYEVDRE